MDWALLCLGFRKRILSGQERAWHHRHCTLSLHLWVFDYLRSNLLTDDPHYLPGSQVRHVLRHIKCTSWQSHTQGHRKREEARRGSLTTVKPLVHLRADSITSCTAACCIVPPDVCVEINDIFWNIYLCFGALEAVDVLHCKCNFPTTSLCSLLLHVVSLPLNSVTEGI